MKKTLLVIAITGFASAFFTQPSDAVNYSDIANATSAGLDTIAKDLGAVMGAGQYHGAKNLGLPGFDIGLRIPSKTLSDANVLKNKDTTIIALPALQAEIGLPAGIDLVVRGVSYESVSYAGGGIKYSIFKQNLGVADFAVSGMVNFSTLSSDYVTATNAGGNACVSIGLPVIKPYIALGFDTTDMTPGSKSIASNPLLNGLKGKASGVRYEAGLNLSPFPFFYVYYAYTVMYGDPGQTAGLGIKF